MIQLFYHIRENRDGGGFVYHEFNGGWGGYRAFTCNDVYKVYKTFDTREEAENYAIERGGVDAYSY